MFAVIGFVLVVIVGLYMTFAGLFGWIGLGLFAGNFKKTSGFLIFTIIGALILYWAYNNSPIHFSMTT